MSATHRFSATRATACLAQPNAPRVFSPAELAQWLRNTGVPVEDDTRTLARFIKTLQQSSLVSPVKRGLYLNRQARPAPMLDEAAHRVRTGAVVSLQTVLGRWGVLNNPVSHVSCVMPGSNVGRVSTQSGVMEFYGIRPDFIHQDDPTWGSVGFHSGSSSTATAEKALLDWLWLSAQPASRLSPPPRQDIEFDDLDAQALEWLAQRMDLSDRLAQFKSGTALSAVPTRNRLRR